MNTIIKSVDILPLVKYYMQEIKLSHLFDKYVPNTNGAEIPPAQVLCLMVTNIMTASKPLYRVEDWLHNYTDGISEEHVNSAKYNDDRLGRCLNYLFDADRSSFMVELSANAIQAHQLTTQTIHNDSTSITFIGDYENEDPKAAKITHGYNKDHRPDCKQLVFGLNISGDGYIPISYQLHDGNQADVSTHTTNWEQLRTMLGKDDFIYVADSKLCSIDNLSTIANNGGQFITIVPRNVKEVKDFLESVREGMDIEWQFEYKTPDSRKKGQTQDYLIYEGEQLKGDYRILWVHSQSKERLEHKSRLNRIAKAEKELENVACGLNQYQLKTREQIEKAVKKALKGLNNYLTVTIDEVITVEKVQIGRGKPGPNTCYKDKEKITYQVKWNKNEDEISKVQRTDGFFPLVDNTTLKPIDVLKTYKEQPYLEKRFSTKKSVLEVTPVFLKSPQRIEAMMFLYFVSLMLVSLIERRIRSTMQEQKIENLPIGPAGMYKKKPTWRTIMDTFAQIHLAMIEQSGQVVHTSLKGLDALRQHVLTLLKVPISTYTKLNDEWWIFIT